MLDKVYLLARTLSGSVQTMPTRTPPSGDDCHQWAQTTPICLHFFPPVLTPVSSFLWIESETGGPRVGGIQIRSTLRSLTAPREITHARDVCRVPRASTVPLSGSASGKTFPPNKGFVKEALTQSDGVWSLQPGTHSSPLPLYLSLGTSSSQTHRRSLMDRQRDWVVLHCGDWFACCTAHCTTRPANVCQSQIHTHSQCTLEQHTLFLAIRRAPRFTSTACTPSLCCCCLIHTFSSTKSYVLGTSNSGAIFNYQ